MWTRIIIALALSGCIVPDKLIERDISVECESLKGWTYCESPLVDLRGGTDSEIEVPCYGDTVYRVDDGYIWSRTCDYVCYEEVCLD